MDTLTDLMIGEMDNMKLDESIYNICGHQLPSNIIKQSHRPQTQPHQESQSDYQLEKFGGRYPFFPLEQTQWPTCHQCPLPMVLLFQVKDPLNLSQFVQMLICPSKQHWQNLSCELCDNQCGLCYQFNTFSLQTPHNRNLPPPSHSYTPYDCHRLIGWEIKDETIPPN
jgi:hypothetical protein